ncbi:hypothetical protein [Lentzea sp. NBRC 102530]|uniref:hypothetical protein n=1 Tax=Lentzea sp. NBRC 102530 TaxID=3032201 RepID=UPI002553F93C|nr:hypothetical protein [Lentzea sp. NBRC 102530]
MDLADARLGLGQCPEPLAAISWSCSKRRVTTAAAAWRRALAMLEHQDREDAAARVRDRPGSAGPG